MANYPKHYKTGEEFPEPTGKVRVYSMQFCPYALRTRIMLEKKNVEYEVVNVNLRYKPDWIFDKYKAGLVPILEIGDKIIPESLISSEYIDDVYSKNGDNLISSDPYKKAMHNLLLYKHTNVYSTIVNGVRNKQRIESTIPTFNHTHQKMALQFPGSSFVNLVNYYNSIRKEDGAREAYLNRLDDFEQVLKNQEYFAGDEVGFVDYMVWPWYERIGPWVDELPGERFPNILQWMKKMQQNPVLMKLATPPHMLKKFIDGKLINAEPYDRVY